MVIKEHVLWDTRYILTNRKNKERHSAFHAVHDKTKKTNIGWKLRKKHGLKRKRAIRYFTQKPMQTTLTREKRLGERGLNTRKLKNECGESNKNVSVIVHLLSWFNRSSEWIFSWSLGVQRPMMAELSFIPD